MRNASLTAAALTLGCLVLFSCTQEDPSPTPPTDAGADASTGADASPGCTKRCNGVCVSDREPLNGCGDTSCDACPSFPHRPAICNVQQACALGSCEPGYLECDDAQPGCETLGTTDPENCGACGQSCNGKACVAGRCQP